ncbi:MAG TPA: caspase family protein [Bryobacteraceae bacterium]|jgi:hypothetical protein
MPKALVIGIDDYKGENALSSAVNDALAFRDKVVGRKLVAAADVSLFTAPQQPGGALAHSKPITDWLYDNIYMGGDNVDRFLFFYAGHGILAYSDAAHTRTRTALVPADVVDLKRDGRQLIDLTELMDVLSLTGPQEQLYFIDACRDMPYEQQPDVTPLGWSGKPPGPERAQFSIFAVSPLGKARGSRNGMGVMTGYLLDGLDAKGLALEYDSEQFAYTVTMQSLCTHARDMVLRGLRNEPAWKQKYQLPTRFARGPVPKPLRKLDDVGTAPLTVHIVPDEAADRTTVKFSVGNYDLAEKFCYPINRNHETVQLQPQRHLMVAASKLGIPDPSREPVDVRVVREVTIRLPMGSPMPEQPAPPQPPPASGAPPASKPQAPAADAGPAPASFEVDRASFPSGARFIETPDPGEWRGAPPIPYAPAGIVEASALEPQTRVRLESLSPPYETWEGVQRLHQTVKPGSYKVTFRLGPEPFSQREIFVRENERIVVSPAAAVTALLRETVAPEPVPPGDVVVSESIGPMQGALLATVLPLVAIKPFDFANQVFHRFDNLVPSKELGDFDFRPLSIVLAIDGDGWDAPVAQVLAGIRCAMITAAGERQLVPEPPLPSGSAAGPGFERLFRAMAPAPLGSFQITVSGERLGEYTLASAGMPFRASVVTAAFRPEGVVEFSQNLLQIPGLEYSSETRPPGSYGRILRALQIGQALYRSGELFQTATGPAADDITNLLRDALFARWVDPVLGPMAYYAALKAVAHGGADAAALPPDLLKTAAGNLLRQFPDLPDSRVIYAREFPEAEVGFEILSGNSLPLLAESVWEAARRARQGGWEDAPIIAMARSVAPGQPWCYMPMLIRGPMPAVAVVQGA